MKKGENIFYSSVAKKTNNLVKTQAKNLDGHFPKDDTNMKSYSTSLSLGKCKSK